MKTWSAVRAKSRAEREWHRVTGTVIGLANSMRPDVKVEKGIELTPPPAEGAPPYDSDERRLEMESDEGLRRFHRYEFLVDPVTKRARVAGAGFSPFLLALLGLVYLGLAGAFFLLTMNRLTYDGVTLPVTPPGKWMYFQAPPWHEPAVVSARSIAWPVLERGLGAAMAVFGFVMLWSSRGETLLSRVGLGSVTLFVAGVFTVCALDRAAYRIEADSTGLRESSVLGWKMTPWTALRGAVEETVYYYARGSSSRSSSMLDHVTHRVSLTDDQGHEVVSIDDNLVPEQGKALVAHVLSRTGLQPEKRERERKMFSYRQ
ncbi:MAG: hypothetical protein LAN62_09085 [Acidobacteriia bacterium]|nr:hypothetical protein [Terriglobia bacterium]